MFFELANSSITFQVYINKAMHSYLDLFVLMYMNDLLMFFSSTEKHIEHVKLMLQRLRKFNLYFKFSKCSFHVFHVNFLNFRMNLDEIAMQINKRVRIERHLFGYRDTPLRLEEHLTLFLLRDWSRARLFAAFLPVRASIFRIFISVASFLSSHSSSSHHLIISSSHHVFRFFRRWSNLRKSRWLDATHKRACRIAEIRMCSTQNEEIQTRSTTKNMNRMRSRS
jgi:hypothetical protein